MKSLGRDNMLESGCATGRSPESGKEKRISQRRCFCFVLMFAGTLAIFYNTNVMMSDERHPKWWSRYNSTKWWVPFKSQRRDVAVDNTTDTSTRTSSSTAETSSSFAPQATQNNSGPPATLPLLSPGAYLVEYPHQYHFRINQPQTCEEQKPFLVLMVPVAPHNRAHRDVIRSTWGGESSVLDKAVKLFFLLGRPSGEGAGQLGEQLLLESNEHRDLIQSDFLDCYMNLTIKTMVMLEWLDSFCSSASYAMKIDSDMFLNVPNLIRMLSNAPKTNYMTGLVTIGGAVLRDPRSKWFVPVELYPHSQYPPYVLGLGYVLSSDLPHKLVAAARHVRALYIEDVYLGLCLQHLGLAPTDPPDGGSFQVVPVQYSRCAFSKLVATTTQETADRVWMWTDFKTPGPYC